MTPALVIDVVADPVCPWCYVGIASFRKARAALGGEYTVETRYRAYQLNPDLAAEGVDRAAFYRAKFPDPARLAAARAALANAALAAGLGDFDSAAPPRLPNTLKAHQLLHLGAEAGVGETLCADLYDGFWRRLEDIGDPDTLVAMGVRAGLDADAVRAALASPLHAGAVSAEAEAFRRAGVSGVPTFIVGERTGFAGALDPATMLDALRAAARQAAPAHPQEEMRS